MIILFSTRIYANNDKLTNQIQSKAELEYISFSQSKLTHTHVKDLNQFEYGSIRVCAHNKKVECLEKLMVHSDKWAKHNIFIKLCWWCWRYPILLHLRISFFADICMYAGCLVFFSKSPVIHMIWIEDKRLIKPISGNAISMQKYHVVRNAHSANMEWISTIYRGQHELNSNVSCCKNGQQWRNKVSIHISASRVHWNTKCTTTLSC